MYLCTRIEGLGIDSGSQTCWVTAGDMLDAGENQRLSPIRRIKHTFVVSP